MHWKCPLSIILNINTQCKFRKYTSNVSFKLLFNEGVFASLLKIALGYLICLSNYKGVCIHSPKIDIIIIVKYCHVFVCRLCTKWRFGLISGSVLPLQRCLVSWPMIRMRRQKCGSKWLFPKKLSSQTFQCK